MNDEEIRELATKHWEWVMSLICAFEVKITEGLEWSQRGKLFIDAFIHGYKHGKVDAENDRKLVD